MKVSTDTERGHFFKGYRVNMFLTCALNKKRWRSGICFRLIVGLEVRSFSELKKKYASVTGKYIRFKVKLTQQGLNKLIFKDEIQIYRNIFIYRNIELIQL